MIQSRLNLEHLIVPINILDNIISINIDSDNKIFVNPLNAKILKELFNYQLHVNGGSDLEKEFKIKFNQYVYDTFSCFINHKEEILINIAKLAKYAMDKEILNLIFYELDCDVTDEDIINTNNKNLVKPKFLRIFKNVNRLDIWTKDNENEYRLSFLSLLSIIKNTWIETVQISAEGEETWLEELSLSSSFIDIVEKYKNAGFELKFYHDWDDDHDVIMITTLEYPKCTILPRIIWSYYKLDN